MAKKKRKKERINEEKKAAASYIMGFYNDVQQLTHWYANYENLLLELESKYGKDSADKIAVDEKDVLKQYCQVIRYHSIKANVSYLAIMGGVNKDVDKDIKVVFVTIKKQFVIKRVDLEVYVNKLNSVIISTVIKNLLESSQDIVNQLYGEEKQTEEEE